MVNNAIHDATTSNLFNKETAYTIDLQNVSGTFAIGEVITSSGGGTATVREYDADNEIVYIGPFTGTAWNLGDTLTGANSGTATISGSGGSVEFDGINDFLQVASSSDFAFCTGAITVEGWVYWSGYSGSFQLTGALKIISISSLVLIISLYLEVRVHSLTSLQLRLSKLIDGITLRLLEIVMQVTLLEFTWMDKFKVQVLGQQIIPPISHLLLVLMIILHVPNQANGISQTCVSLKETAQYTSDFTVPTTPLTSITNTVLLTCQGAPIQDNGPSTHVITSNGSPIGMFSHSNFCDVGVNLTIGTLLQNVKSLNYAKTVTNDSGSGILALTY